MAVTGTDITITTRTAKGSALTHEELDANQAGLKEAIENHSHDEFVPVPDGPAGAITETDTLTITQAGASKNLLVEALITAIAALVPTPQDGNDGIGVTGFGKISGTSAPGTVDVYEMTFTGGAAVQINVQHGSNGADGVSVTGFSKISGTGEAGTTDVYEMTFSSGPPVQISVVHGSNGADGGATITQTAPVSLAQNASTNITGTTVVAVYEPDDAGVNLIPTMTSNTAPSGTAFASTEYNNNDTYKAWRAFNGNASDYWASAAAAPVHALGYDFGAATRITKYSLDVVTRASYAPKSWQFQGSNNNTDWTTLDTRTDVTSWGSVNTYSFANTNTYRYYRINITDCISGTDTDVCEFKMFNEANIQLIPGTDYSVLRNDNSGSQTLTVKRLKAGTALMVIDYI